MKKRSSDDKVVVPSKTKSSKERPMNTSKYIGMDVHMATTVIAVLNSVGETVAEAVVKQRYLQFSISSRAREAPSTLHLKKGPRPHGSMI